MSENEELRTTLGNRTASEVVRISEALQLLKVSRNHLMKGIRSGQVPIVHVLGMKRIPRVWIDAAIKKALEAVAA
jgi:hypothetical protein